MRFGWNCQTHLIKNILLNTENKRIIGVLTGLVEKDQSKKSYKNVTYLKSCLPASIKSLNEFWKYEERSEAFS
jgi:hypothetical protein